MRLATLAGLGFLLAAGSASAAIVAFDTPPSPDILTSVTAEGFRFTSQHFHLFGDGHFASNGTTHVAYEATRGFPITMAPAGGGTFTLRGFDGAEAVTIDDGGSRPPAEAIGVVGYRADGTSVNAQLTLDGIHDGGGAGTANDFQTFSLPGTFSNLTSVLFYGIRADGRDGGIALDNLDVLLQGIEPGAANCAATSANRTALNDLGAGTYAGFTGGLYPNGMNVRPASHEVAGLQIAGEIRPLNAQGQVDSNNGQIGFVSIGMTSTNQIFEVFEFDSTVDAFRNPRVTTVNGAQSGQTAFQWADPDGAAWAQLAATIASKGLSAAQIQVAWIKLTVNGSDVGGWGAYPPFPATASLLQAKVKQVVRNLKSRYPNMRIAYLSSRIYGNYATNGVSPEPIAYEEGFGIKWLIEEQINGDPALTFSGNNAQAPFLSWGPYLWANGLGSDGVAGGIPGRQDGLEYACQDFAADGMSPSASGRRKASDQLGAFLNTDSTTLHWYLDPDPPLNGNPFYADLDGVDDYLQAADSDRLSVGNGSADSPLTLEAWFKADGMTLKQNLIGKWDGLNQEYKLYIAANTVRLDLRDQSTQAVVSAYMPTNQAAPAGSWHHLAVTYDGRGGPAAAAGIIFYLDGVAMPVVRINSAAYVAMENRPTPLQIGREGPGNKLYNGAIDEIRIWNAVRSQGQIQSQMAFELAGTESGLVAYWKLNEGAAAMAADSSPRGHTATLYNGAAWLPGGPMGPPVPDVTPPQILFAVANNVSDSGATITFRTDEVTTGWVSYSGGTPCPCADVYSPAAGTDHAVSLAGLAADTAYTFEAKVVDASGNFQVGPTLSFRTLAAPPDVTPPTVSLVPVGATVSGTVLIQALSTDNVGVASVQFKVDGTAVGPPDDSAPYSASWDTTGAANGLHTLTAESRDAAGNLASASLIVNVSNGANPSSPFYLDLDGLDDYLQAADSDRLSVGNGSADSALTLELWFRADGLTAKQNLVGKWLDGTSQEYKLYLAANSIRLDLRDRSSQGMASATTSVNQAALAGSWHHLAVTYDGRGGATAAAGIIFYLDGVVIPITRINSVAYVAMENTPAPLQIGREGPGNKQYNGAIDEIRVWNAVRSQAQVQSQRTIELSGAEPGLVAYWKLNEGAATTANDGSPWGHTATLNGGAAWLPGGPMGP